MLLANFWKKEIEIVPDPVTFAKYEDLDNLQATYPEDYKNAKLSRRYKQFETDLNMFSKTNNIYVILAESTLKELKKALKNLKKIKLKIGVCKTLGGVAAFTKREKSKQKTITKLGQNIKIYIGAFEEFFTLYYRLIALDKHIGNGKTCTYENKCRKLFKNTFGSIFSRIEDLENLISKNSNSF